MKALQGDLAKLLLSYQEGRDALRLSVKSGDTPVEVTLSDGKTYIISKGKKKKNFA
jgi:hypothetical protein